MDNRRKVNKEIVERGPLITEEMACQLVQPYTVQEVKKALFSIDCNKSPGPDGFGSAFFKERGRLWVMISVLLS